MNPNFQQLYKKIVQNLSLASISLGVFNAVTNQTTIKSLQENLEVEKVNNSKLINKINNLIIDNSNKMESIFNKNLEFNNNKLEILNNKINNMVENQTIEDNQIIEVNNSIKEINNELEDILNKLDESLKSSIIDLDIIKIFTNMQEFYSNLNYFQCIALTHLSAFIFIFLSLTSLISLYFGDYLIIRYNIGDKYPRIDKFIKLRRKFQVYYLIKDLALIFIILIALTYINIMFFLNFTL